MTPTLQPRPAAGAGAGADSDAGSAAPVGEWMRSVGVWLGAALMCRGLRLLWLPRRLEAACWSDDPSALDASTIEGETADGSGGWLLPLEQGSSGMLCLFCASSATPEQRAGMVETLQRAAQAVATSWTLTAPCASEDAQLAVVDRQAVRASVHELRNALNSLLMNAATLTWRIEALPEPLRRFASQLQHDGERCSAALQQLEEQMGGGAKAGRAH